MKDMLLQVICLFFMFAALNEKKIKGLSRVNAYGKLKNFSVQVLSVRKAGYNSDLLNIFLKFHHRLNEHDNQNINYTMMKHGELLHGRLTALTASVTNMDNL